MFLQHRQFESSSANPLRGKQIHLLHLWEVFSSQMHVCLPHALSRRGETQQLQRVREEIPAAESSEGAPDAPHWREKVHVRAVWQSFQDTQQLLSTREAPQRRAAVRVPGVRQQVQPVQPAQVTHADPHWGEAVLLPPLQPGLLRLQAAQETQLW